MAPDRKLLAAALVAALTACTSPPDAAPAAAPTETVTGTPTPTPAPSPTPDPDPVVPTDWLEEADAVVAATRPSVVALFNAEFGWTGSTGFLVAPDLVVTDRFAVERDDRRLDLTALTFDGRRLPTTLVGLAEHEGVALLRLAEPLDAPPLVFGGSATLRPGEPLLAIGHPTLSAADGGWQAVAGTYERTQERKVWADIPAVVSDENGTTDGMAGAPLLNLAGEVVAVVCCHLDLRPSAQARLFEPSEFEILVELPLADARLRGGYTAEVVTAELERLQP